MHALALASLGAATSQDADREDARIADAFAAMIAAADGDALALAFDSAPSAAVYRHLWRSLARVEDAPRAAGLSARIFALPLTLIVGSEERRDAPVELPGVLDEAAALTAMLRGHGALGGNQTFTLAPTLVAADALAMKRIPILLRWGAFPRTHEAPAAPHDLPPAPMQAHGGDARVYLRFLVGAALAAPGADLYVDGTVGAWGMPAARWLAQGLAIAGTTVLALPHAPSNLVVALQRGRGAQREVSAQLFASNAIRRFRAATGEPSAVISAHYSAESETGGELRLSLSSVFDPADAEGFRCPLYAADHVGEVVEMLVTLMRDCRVNDVQVLPGVHADRDDATGAPLLFKPGALPALH